MINISLPDGSVRSFDKPVSGADIAAAIGPGLAKAALALRVDGKMVDLAHVVDRDAKIGIVTSRDPEALELLRHDAAHVLAQAVQELFPGTQITFGPSTEDGFYYDFVRAEPFTPEDFEKIEKRMAEIVDRDLPIVREVWDRARIKEHFKANGESFKAEWADELPKDEEISVYKQGGWLDMCLGPHLPSTGKLGKAFKLLKVSGAYWRGDASKAQLQRVYGTVFFSDKELKEYLRRIEEAEKRDHRRLGREMGLFHQQEEAAGMVFWHPKGWTFWRTLESYLRRKLDAAGYVEVKTPQLVDRKLWEASGHWEKFRENMYLSENEEGLREYIEDPAKRIFALKPMNCPCHVQIFNQGLRSYRELPLRMAEFGSCHRFEPSGALHGIEGRRPRPQAQPRRGRVLRPQAGVRAARRDRPRLAVRHAAGRLRAAGAAGRRLRDRGRDAQAAGHAAPRHLRQLRAHDRHSHRKLRRPLPAVAGADASGGSHDRQRRRRLCRGGRRGAEGRRPQGRDRPAQREDQLQGPRALAGPRAADPGGRPARHGGPHGGGPPAGLGKAGGP